MTARQLRRWLAIAALALGAAAAAAQTPVTPAKAAHAVKAAPPAGKRMLTQRAFSVDSFFGELRAARVRAARRQRPRLSRLRRQRAVCRIAARRASSRLLRAAVFGNPHSEHAASLRQHARRSTRRAGSVLRFFDAGDDYVVCFTANASGAIKLVAEAYPFGAARRCVLSADNHNSVNGIREFARRAGARVDYLPLHDDLRLDHPRGAAGGGPAAADCSRFRRSRTSPACSTRCRWSRAAQSLGYHVLLDAAAFVPTHPLSLRARPADFVALSFYKMFGYPTGVGALVARRDALAGAGQAVVRRRHGRVRLRAAAARTSCARCTTASRTAPPTSSTSPRSTPGFAFRDRVGVARLTAHVMDADAVSCSRACSAAAPRRPPLVRDLRPRDRATAGGGDGRVQRARPRRTSGAVRCSSRSARTPRASRCAAAASAIPARRKPRSASTRRASAPASPRSAPASRFPACSSASVRMWPSARCARRSASPTTAAMSIARSTWLLRFVD